MEQELNATMELPKEQHFFISVLRDYLNNNCTPSPLPEFVDSNVIKRYADQHQLTAIFYKQTKNSVFHEAYAAQLYQSAKLKRSITIFQEAMDSCQYIMIKGAVVASLYQNPQLRSMGDIDALIHISDREKVNSILQKCGFQFQYKIEGTWLYDQNGILFEIHDSLVHRKDELRGLVDYFSKVWDYVEDGVLDWSFHLIFLLEHLRHHFVGHGVGFRQFMDVAIVCKKCDIDWLFLESELKKIGLYDFATTVFAFNKRWFGISVPFEMKELSNEFYIVATQKIFEDGVFGFDNEDNATNKLAMQMHYRGISKTEAQKEYLIEHFFPKYEIMCGLPYCAYVKRCKVLLPICHTSSPSGKACCI